MDANGSAIVNVFIERLWKTVKYENIYLNPPDSTIDLYRQLKKYFNYYKIKRRDQVIENQNLSTGI